MGSDANHIPDIEPRSPDSKWTVMVFMGADDIPGDASLLEQAHANIKQMMNIPRSERLNTFVQLHASGGVQRQDIQKTRNWFQWTSRERIPPTATH